MAYEKHTWETGETITAEKLNNLENKTSVWLIPTTVEGNKMTLTKTWQEIYDGWNDYDVVVITYEIQSSSAPIQNIKGKMPITSISHVDATQIEGPENWAVQLIHNTIFYASGPNDYPSMGNN